MDDTGDVSFLDAGQNVFVRLQRKTGKRFDQLFADYCSLPSMGEGQLRATVMKTYGLSASEARYFVELAREADAEAVVQDAQALKQEFTYRNFSHDLWQILLMNLDRPYFTPLAIAGLPRIVAEEFLEDCYYEKEAWEPLTKHLGGDILWRAPTFERLLEHLEKAQRFDLIERFCISVARASRSRFFAERAGRRGQVNAERIEAFKEYAIEAHDRAVEWMQRIGHAETAAELGEQRKAVREERLPPLPEITDLRRMDETVFWELIARSRAESESLEEQQMLLERLLLTFKAADIKRFGSLYAAFMRKLHHWDVWALAYIALGGCSDDSFADFRTWLILQGDPALVEQALNDTSAAAKRVPRDPELPDGSLSAMIEEAFLQRHGAPMDMASIDLDRPKGREWPEEAVETRYPELARHYSPDNVL